jgi:hypothetical protein
MEFSRNAHGKLGLLKGIERKPNWAEKQKVPARMRPGLLL